MTGLRNYVAEKNGVKLTNGPKVARSGRRV